MTQIRPAWPKRTSTRPRSGTPGWTPAEPHRRGRATPHRGPGRHCDDTILAQQGLHVRRERDQADPGPRRPPRRSSAHHHRASHHAAYPSHVATIGEATPLRPAPRSAPGGDAGPRQNQSQRGVVNPHRRRCRPGFARSLAAARGENGGREGGTGGARVFLPAACGSDTGDSSARTRKIMHALFGL
jgi:hypothetical protein